MIIAPVQSYDLPCHLALPWQSRLFIFRPQLPSPHRDIVARHASRLSDNDGTGKDYPHFRSPYLGLR